MRAPLVRRRLPARVRRGLLDAGLVALAGADSCLGLCLGPPTVWDCTSVLSLAASAVLLLRRRHPRLTLLLTLPGLFVGTSLIAAMVAQATLARRRGPDRQVWAACTAVVAGSFVPWPPRALAGMALEAIAEHLIYSAMLGVGSTVLGLLALTRAELSARVTELAAVRHEERRLYAESVIARERARLAREMHDVVAHQAGLIAVQAGALQVTAVDDRTRHTAGTLRELAVATLEELRTMILLLRSSDAGPPELAPRPRMRDIPRLVAESGVEATVDLRGLSGRSLPEAVERTAFRTVQEALTNVRKHAPGAPTTVTVDRASDTLRVNVSNARPTGTPLELPGGGHGLVGLRERSALIGGTLSAGPDGDGGFSVRLVVPLSP
ncbi:sensor histidine kinase [Streptomyces natalensis]|uniref:histidine kinase n=1 Tax=Streptomyces natalensis ATCC 27448 TaxID=1240678 RepID=A0A0D7CT52_9ACTN|nr:histidine kinase [Streptomyces natalensis]KIZ19206.1 hypothetical protein SNA_01265 [Streptomyces natalensis ATCC 27448]